MPTRPKHIPPKTRNGRPPTHDEEIIREILHKIAHGATGTKAARDRGISSTTWARWKMTLPGLLAAVESAESARLRLRFPKYRPTQILEILEIPKPPKNLITLYPLSEKSENSETTLATQPPTQIPETPEIPKLPINKRRELATIARLIGAIVPYQD